MRVRGPALGELWGKGLSVSGAWLLGVMIIVLGEPSCVCASMKG